MTTTPTEQQLRADHAENPPRRGRRRRGAFPLHGQERQAVVAARRVAKMIRACQDLPGQELMQYVDKQGVCQDVTSTDVNDYLREITGKDITAKDFRT